MHVRASWAFTHIVSRFALNCHQSSFFYWRGLATPPEPKCVLCVSKLRTDGALRENVTLDVRRPYTNIDNFQYIDTIINCLTRW